MAKWARPSQAADFDVRSALIAHLEQISDVRPWGERAYGVSLDALRSGRALVLPAWAIAAHVPAGTVERGVHAFYRIEPDGRLVRVVARRDPADPMTITTWTEVPA